MPVSIDLGSSSLFISIVKQGIHSFVMLGSYSGIYVEHLLCRVGKVLAIPDEEKQKKKCSWFSILAELLYLGVDAELVDEGLSRDSSNPFPMTYQAYDISYEQYLEFIQVLESLQTSNRLFSCYKPRKKQNNTVHFDLTSELSCSPKRLSSTFSASVEKLSVNNTCRHGAIGLIEQIIRAPISSSISSFFFRELPYKSCLVSGKPSSDSPFYVLPPSPAAYPGIDKVKQVILEKLYKRMERMVCLDHDAVQTQNKFLCLKGLYQQILGPQKELSLVGLLESIRTWTKTNQSTLIPLRKTYFWDHLFTRTAESMKTMNSIEQHLVKSLLPGGCFP
jgi:hypothetical protein